MLLSDKAIGTCQLRYELHELTNEGVVQLKDVLEKGCATEEDAVAFLLETSGDLRNELRDVFRDSFDYFNRGKDGFLTNVGRIAADTLEDVLVEVSGQLGSADLAEHAEDKTDDVVIVAVEVDADTVGGHHEQL